MMVFVHVCCVLMAASVRAIGPAQSHGPGVLRGLLTDPCSGCG